MVQVLETQTVAVLASLGLATPVVLRILLEVQAEVVALALLVAMAFRQLVVLAVLA